MTLAGLVIAGVAGQRSLSRRPSSAQLQQQAARLGLELHPVGKAQDGLFATTLPRASLRFGGIDGLSATLDDLVVRQYPFGSPALSIGRIHFAFEGEPSELWQRLNSLLASGLPTVSLGEVTAEYHHRLLGRLLGEGLTVSHQDDAIVVHARRINLGTRTWDEAVFSAHLRNQLLEVGLGAPSIKEAPLQLGYFASTRGVAQWTLTVKHQPAGALVRQLGLALGSALDSTAVGGSATLIVPDDTAQPTRGSVQFALDHWPKPDWPDAALLLGNTASFIARIAPSADFSTWDLLDAEGSLSIFSMQGTGRIQLGARPSVALDVQGRRRCAQLEAHLPPSGYSDQVKHYLLPSAMASANSSAATTDRRREEVLLRLQLASGSTEQPLQVAWKLTPGCGLPGLESGNFQNLSLPASVSNRPEPSQR